MTIFLPRRFQMVSLLKLAKITEEGVRFLSPHDGTPMYVFTPTILFCICLILMRMQAPHSRTFDPFTELNRIGYHNATRRCDFNHFPGHGEDARGHATVRSMVGPMH